MSNRTISRGRIPSALKHGAYSGMTLLPGEDATAFNKLHNDLIQELSPTGTLEDDIIQTIARLTWRKQNLLTCRPAQEAKPNFALPKPGSPSATEPSSSPKYDFNPLLAAMRTADQNPIIDIMGTKHLLDELSIIDRLDGIIDRCLKRLLFVRGIKSLPPSSPTMARVSQKS